MSNYVELWPNQIEELRQIAQRMVDASAAMGKAAEVNARVQGMIAENQIRERGGYQLAYGEAAFQEQADSVLHVMKNSGII